MSGGNNTKRPAPGNGAGHSQDVGTQCPESYRPEQRPEINFVQADVIRLAARTLSPSTWAAIGAACKLNPSENSEGLRTILDLARLHGARPEPVAAYFGWLRPARIEMRNGALRIAGPGGDFVHLYQGLASRDGIVLVPLADFETVCALALCRAQRYDRDRRVQVVPWGCRP